MYIFVLCLVYLVEYIMNPNSIVEIALELLLPYYCSSPNLPSFVEKNGL